MNKKEFTIYLHKPHLIDKHAEIALQEVVTDFPYFHAAQQLLLKAHQNNGSYHFDRQLPITSLLHGQRDLLYAYLKDSLVKEFEQVSMQQPTFTEEVLTQTFREQESRELEHLFTTKEEEPVEEEKPVFVSAPIEFVPMVLPPEMEPVAEVKADVPEEIIFKTEPEPLPEIQPETYTYTPSAPVVEPQVEYKSEPVDLDLPFQNFNEKYSIPEIKEETPVAETIAPKAIETNPIEPKEEAAIAIETEPIKKEIIAPPALAFELERHEPEPIVTAPQTHESTAEERVINSIEPHDFLTWLQSKKSHITHTPKPVEHFTETPQPVEETNIPEKEQAPETTEKPVIEGAKKMRKFNELIDKFIETSPSISKPQPAKFYNPAQKAKESITENFDLVTETLAKIYTKQNNYKKAILVYEKLSLLYPEKISYFAAQISELQTLLNK